MNTIIQYTKYKTSTGEIFDAGKAAAFTRKGTSSATPFVVRDCSAAVGLLSLDINDRFCPVPFGKFNVTSNRLGLTPPPTKVDLNCEIVLSAIG